MIIKNISLFRILERQDVVAIRRVFRSDVLLSQFGFTPEYGDNLLEVLGVEDANHGGRLRKRYSLSPSRYYPKKISVDVSLEFDPLPYLCFQFEVIRLKGAMGKYIFDSFFKNAAQFWFLGLSEVFGFHRIYIGDLSRLRSYIYQDPFLVSEALPGAVAFKTETDLCNFSWIECEWIKGKIK